MRKKKRMNYKNMTQYEARKLISESKGMSKAKWNKLQKIAGNWRGY